MKTIKKLVLIGFAVMMFLLQPTGIKAREEQNVNIQSTYEIQPRNMRITYNPNKRTFEWNADRYPGADYFDAGVNCRNLITGSTRTYTLNGFKGSVQTTLVKGQKYEVLVVARYWSGNHIIKNLPLSTQIITG